MGDLDYTFYVRPRSISLAPERSDTIKVAPLVLTSSNTNSWAETNKHLIVKFDEGEDIQGPITIAAVIWEPTNEKKITDTRLIVFTDTDFMSNNFLNQYSNADLILNAIRWLSKSTDIIHINEKKIEVPRLDLTSKQKRIIIVILCLMPLIIVLIGGIQWLKGHSDGTIQ